MARHQQLHVWQQARTLVRLVCENTRNTSSAGDLVSQLRRAAISVAANIAEGAERGSDREFRRFLKIADGSNAEVQALTTIAGDAGLLDDAVVQVLTAQAVQVGCLLGGLMRRLSG
jgi:four helix bundle protein